MSDRLVRFAGNSWQEIEALPQAVRWELLPAAGGVPAQRAPRCGVRRDRGDVQRPLPGRGRPGDGRAWVSAVRYQLARAGEHRSASAVDLVIAATAARHGLTVLHDDAGYRAVARHAPDLAEHNIHDLA